MIADLLLPVAGVAGDDRALSVAVELAREFGAHLTVLGSVHLPAPMVSPWGLAPVGTFETIYADLRASARGQMDRARAQLEREGLPFDVHLAESFLEPRSLAALHARYADACVLPSARQAGDAAPFRRDMFDSVLMESGRPVITIPIDKPVRTPVTRVVVAWKPRREATRAVHDALPLLARAESVEVVVVNPDDGITSEGELPGADIAAHLSRHGLRVQVTCLQRGTKTAAATLLWHCYETDAHLLVTGGLGHSRLREWALGGVTRELLECADLPVFFSH